MADWQATIGQLRDVWQQWSAQRRLFVAGGAALAIGGFIALVLLSSGPSYAPLMTQLSTADAASISARLQQQGTPFKFSDSGTAVLVPQHKVTELRMLLAAEGLPKGGGVGFELFDKDSLGRSRFSEQLNYRRGLEGELRRTIIGLDVVDDARVHIVLPKRSLFQETTQNASAAVTLLMQRGRVITAKNVQAVVHLVSASVEGLSADNVTVIDGKGVVLAKGGGHDAGFEQGLTEQQRMEHRLEQQVKGIVERVVGVGAASVKASVLLDFTEKEFTSEEFDADNPAMRSEQTQDEAKMADGPAQGVPGVQSNLAGGPVGAAGQAAAGGATGVQGSKQSATRNYELSKQTRREIQRIPRVKRLSVAVLVDGIRTVNADGTTSVAGREAGQLDRLAEVVKSSVGFNAARGDQVVVDSMAFTHPAIESPVKVLGKTWLDWLALLWRPISAVLFLGLLFGVMRATRRLSEEPAQAEQDLLTVPRSVRELEAAMRIARDGGPPRLELQEVRRGVAATMAATPPDPEKAAAVLKGWLAESQ